MDTFTTELDRRDPAPVAVEEAGHEVLDRRRTPTEPSERPMPGPSLGVALGLMFALLGFFIGSQVIADNSFFTHLANGRAFLDGKGIVRVDPYSFSATGEKVTVQSWLPTIIYAWLDANVGGFAIRLLNGALGALIAAGTWKLTQRLEQLLVRLALVGATLTVAAFMWGPRPTLFGLLGLVALLMVQQQMLPLWSLLPVMWLWVNSHGSFPLGLVAVGAIAVGAAIDHRRLPVHELRVLGWAGVGMLGGAISPLGFDLLWFPIHLMTRREALANVGEWSPPAFDEPLGLVLVAFVGLHIVAAARGARWSALLPGGIFLFASALAVRNIAPAMLVMALTLAPHLGFEIGTLTASMRGFIPRAVSITSVVGLCLGGVMVTGQAPVSLESFPVDEVSWLDDRDLVANPDVHLIHRDTVGNYLELRYGTDASVFVDDRFDFYPLDILDDHRSLFFGGDYREILDRYEADVVLWDGEGGFASWLAEAPEWRIAHRTDDWLIACRAGSTADQRCH
ncbi:MAG: hypothetical protein R2733_21690 [Acidimicrobiales bacterium]